MNKTLVRATQIAHVRNMYVALDGTLRYKKFPELGLWRFDGQFFYLPKPKAEK